MKELSRALYFLCESTDHNKLRVTAFKDLGVCKCDIDLIQQFNKQEVNIK